MKTKQVLVNSSRLFELQDANISDSDIFNTHLSFYSGRDMDDPYREHRQRERLVLLGQVEDLMELLSEKQEQLLESHEVSLLNGEQAFNDLIARLRSDHSLFLEQLNFHQADELRKYQKLAKSVHQVQNEIESYLNTVFFSAAKQSQKECEIRQKLAELTRKVKTESSSRSNVDFEKKYLSSLRLISYKAQKSKTICGSESDTRNQLKHTFHIQSTSSLMQKGRLEKSVERPHLGFSSIARSPTKVFPLKACSKGKELSSLVRSVCKVKDLRSKFVRPLGGVSGASRFSDLTPGDHNSSRGPRRNNTRNTLRNPRV